MERQVNTSLFVPDYMARSLLTVDFKLLKEKGIRYVAFDADSTLVPFRGTVLSDETKEFLMRQRPLFDKWCIASNRLQNDLVQLAESMDAQVIRATLLNRKPQLRFFKQVIDFFDAPPEQIAMIGDKLFADIWGAKRAGMTTVWVEKVGPDSPWDRLFRTREREWRVLKKYAEHDR